MGTDQEFLVLFQNLIDRYELPPEAASKLLQKILWILSSGREEQSD